MRQTYVAAAALFIALSSSTSAMAVFFYPMQERFEIRPQPVYPAQRPYLAPVQRMFFPPRTIPRFGAPTIGRRLLSPGPRANPVNRAGVYSKSPTKAGGVSNASLARERATTNPAAAAPTLSNEASLRSGALRAAAGNSQQSNTISTEAPRSRRARPQRCFSAR